MLIGLPCHIYYAANYYAANSSTFNVSGIEFQTGIISDVIKITKNTQARR